MALSYLWSIAAGAPQLRFADILEQWPGRDRAVVLRMLDRRLNAPLTSSCGRLFDAVAALCGIRSAVNYEGQAAIELEQAIEPDEGCYAGNVSEECGEIILDPFPMVECVVEDVRRQTRAGIIAARFHNGIVRVLAEAASLAAGKSGLERVLLSGGVFQNAYLSERLEGELAGLGLEVFPHVLTPANDACIALGQAWIGAAKLMAGAGAPPRGSTRSQT